MSIWRDYGNKQKVIILSKHFGGGINLSLDQDFISDNDVVESYNMSLDDYPLISCRNTRMRMALPQVTNLRGLGQRSGSEIHVLTSETWWYATPTNTQWSTISTNMSTGNVPLFGSCFIEFNREADKHTILADASSSGIMNYSWDGTSLTALTSDAPRSFVYATHKFRIFGVDSNRRTVKHSALSSVTDWITADNAGSVTITTANGLITALVSYQGNLIIFAEHSMHILYGTNPSDFQVVDISKSIGCVGRKAFCEVNGILYFISTNGIYSFDGSLPVKMSDKIRPIFDKIVWNKENLSGDQVGTGGYIRMSNYENKLFISYSTASNNLNTRILVFDTEKNVWTEENGSIYDFANVDGKLYGIDSSGYIWDMCTTQRTGKDDSTTYYATTGASTYISWWLKTKGFKSNENLSYKSIQRSIYFEHIGTTDAEIKVGISTNLVNSIDIVDEDTSTSINYGTISTEWIRNRIILPTSYTNPSKFYQYIISGSGFKKIKSLSIKMLTIGSDE